MSMTRTVSATSLQRNPQGQQGQDQQQRVNWGRDRNGSGSRKNSTTTSSKGRGADTTDSIPISKQKDKGYRLGDGGGSSNDAATSALAEIHSNWGGNNKVGGVEMNQQQQVQRREGRQGHDGYGGGANHHRERGGGLPGASHSNGVPVAPANPRRNQEKIEVNSKPSIVEYYASHGADLHRLRKNCKVSGPESGSSKYKQTVSLDCFHPPAGYTLADIPEPGQGLNQSQDEIPISPAVLLASNSRRERRTAETPELNREDFIEQIEQRGRRNKKANAIEKTPEEPDLATAPNESSLNGSFPEDSFNDADLIFASQQVENEHAANGGTLKQQSPTSDIRKRDINGNTKNIPNKMSTPVPHSNAPLTSTPLPASNRKPQKEKETPKARTCGLPRMRNKSSGQKSSMFENSTADIPLSPLQAEAENEKENDAGTPRKILKFDESPIKRLTAGKEISKCGDFLDDDDDHLFTQLEMPGEVVKAPENAADSNRSNNTGMDSLLNESDLATIAKMEALQCRSASTSGDSSRSIASASRSSERRSTRSSTRTTNKCSTNKTESSDLTDNTQTPRRRLGLSLNRTTKKT